MEKTDAELISGILDGDESGFTILLDRHLSAVYKFAYRYMHDAADAEDIAQEAFVRVWKNIKKFDLSKNFRTWVLAIAKNAALDVIKKKKPMRFSEIGEEEEKLEAILAPYMESPKLADELFDQSALGANLSYAMEKIPSSYRTVLALRYTDHLKFREIAETLGEPIDTVKSKHRRGLALLRKFIGTDGSNIA
jgi:RNA polymerase sigma-70 factor, ECF subfamily